MTENSIPESRTLVFTDMVFKALKEMKGTADETLVVGDMNSWAVSACYPRSTFYPLSLAKKAEAYKNFFKACGLKTK